jgi:hypothetical protein
VPIGGHFPALEAPVALAADIRAFFRSIERQAADILKRKTEAPSRGSLLNFWLFGAAHYFV